MAFGGTRSGKTWAFIHMVENEGMPPWVREQRRYRITIERTMRTRERPDRHVVAVVECWGWSMHNALSTVKTWLASRPEPRYGQPPIIHTIPQEAQGEVIHDMGDVASPSNPPAPAQRALPGPESRSGEITGRIHPPGMRPPND